MKETTMNAPKPRFEDAPWQECECGGMTFTSVLMFKRISALVSPSGKEENIPVEVYKCNDCGKVPGFVNKNIPGFPEDLKATKKL